MKKETEELKSLLKNNKSIVIACSGGPDSMCLLSLVNSVKNDFNKIICAHVNHKKRKESDQEAIMVEKYCNENNIIFEQFVINEYHEKTNFQDDARKIRYSFLNDLVKKYNATCLMTAHHGDDLIETVLMRITRGSNIKGYQGFKKKSKWNDITIYRPLIGRTKEEILTYLNDKKIPYAIDASNLKNDYTRNRYRNNIIPQLKKEEENLHKKYYKFSEELSKYYEYVYKEALIVLDQIKDDNNNIDVDLFLKQDDLIKEMILSILIEEKQKNDILEINDKHLSNMIKTLNCKKSNSLIDLPNGYVFGKEYNKIVFEKYENVIKNDSYLFDNKYENQRFVIYKTEVFEKNNNVIALDTAEISLPLFVRYKKDGDKISVLNSSGRQKLSDIFNEKKISSLKRNSYPIIVDSNDNIIWIPGLKKSKFAKSKDEKYDILLKYEEK